MHLRVRIVSLPLLGSAALLEFAVCSQQSCSLATRTDCASWLKEVDADLPTITVAPPEPSGADLPGARVLIDGTAAPPGPPDAAVPLDPGPHQIRRELAGSQAASLGGMF